MNLSTKFSTTLGTLVALLLVAGCQPTSSRGYPMVDHDKTFNVFIQSVRDYYATRDDGKLSDPVIKDRGVTFFYRYNLVKNGMHTEEVRLTEFRPYNSIKRESGDLTWSVEAYYARDGADPEAPAVRDAVLDRMKSALGITEQK